MVHCHGLLNRDDVVMSYQGWGWSADEVVAMALEELGLRILDDVVQSSARTGERPNEHTWLVMAANGYHRRADVIQACSEAWTWLRSKTLVAGDPSQSYATGWVFVTRRGKEVLERGLEFLRSVERLDVDLHPSIDVRVRSQFQRGDFETAVFVAFKELEIRVRKAIGASNSLVGTALMKQAFGAGKPLAQAGADRGEVVAEMELFAGALGLFKNPTSHRVVDYGSATEAAEVILVADLLIRLLDRRVRDVVGPSGDSP